MRSFILVALLFLPVVAADHVYSHRYIIDGRLVGVDGLPLPGREIELMVEGDEFFTPCRDWSHPITNENGDFEFCYHMHELQAGSRLTVSHGNASETRGVDVAFRRTNLVLREENESGVEPPTWKSTYRISGRVWRPGPIELEGVKVFGEAVVDLPVNLTIHADDGSLKVVTTHTNGYGDFDLELETVEDPSNLSLTLEALGRGQPTQLSAFSHRTYATIYVPPNAPAQSGERSAQEPDEGSRPSPPGSATPRVNPVLGVAFVLALVAAMLLSRRGAK